MDNLDPLRRDMKELSTRVEQVHGDVRRLGELLETNVVYMQENIKRIEDKEIAGLQNMTRERITDLKNELIDQRKRHEKDIEDLRQKFTQNSIKVAAGTGTLSVIVSIVFFLLKGMIP